MNNFILFGYNVYYPNGGATDLLSFHSTLKEANQEALRLDDYPGGFEHYQIYSITAKTFITFQFTDQKE